MKPIHIEDNEIKSQAYPIVAIGASAGGLEAVTQLLKSLPPDTGMAFVYIQHLDPNHESMLSSILAKSTTMKVVQAEDLVRIEQNHLFIIPPDKNMSLLDGVITLNDREPRPVINMPIDQFFVSVAEKHKEGSIGILLSGTGNDGTLGLKAIKAAGGFTFAQDESAKFQSMPKSAVAEGVVDFVLSPQNIAIELGRLSKQSDLLTKVVNLPGEVGVAVEPIKEISNSDEEDIIFIIKLLKKFTGVDFLHYKRSTVSRRILRRMVLLKLESLNDYTRYLQQHPGEAHMLYQDILIHVTSFFRDTEALEYLQKTVIPKILKSKRNNEPFRVWVPGCSTGEEAYSMAILILEVLGDSVPGTPIQIFATDISDVAIAKARLGLYTKHELANVSTARLQRFFVRVDGSYRIQNSVRDLCIFAPHNLFRDPPFSRLDLISCCNLLIYLDDSLQKKAISTFHHALNQSGYLVLGKSESIGISGHLFVQLEKSFKIFSTKHEGRDTAQFDINPLGPDQDYIHSKQENKSPDGPATPKVEKLVDDILLSQYVPPSVVVNLDLEILQFRGSTGFFLEPSPGKASLNLVKMAKPGLAFELRNAIHKANKLGQRVRKQDLEIKNKDTRHPVSIEVIPLKTNTEERLFLVLFQESLPVLNDVPLSRDEQINKLQEELSTVREDMRSIVEDQEASTEELQSANEEIISSNEELQSMNEELQTSKEEMESTNEELMTINTQLQIRNEELSESYEYAEALLDTIREAVIVLGTDFKVRVANKAFYQVFKVTEQDTEGHTLFELGNRQWDLLKLRQLLDEVNNADASFYGLEIEHNFPIIGNKTMLINARKVIQKTHRQVVILLAIEDITEHRAAQKVVAERETWFRNMANNATVMIWIADATSQWTFVNTTGLQFAAAAEDDMKGDGWLNFVHIEDRQKIAEYYRSQFEKKLPFEIETRFRRHDGEYRWMLCTGKPTFSPEGHFTGFTGSCADMHEKKVLFEQLDQQVQERTRELQEANKELSRSNSELQQFAYVASHDLQEPLRKIMTFSDKLQQYAEKIPVEERIYIDKIASSSQRMTRLIDDLLNFSRISRSNRKFVRTDLNEVVRDVMVDFDLVVLQEKAQIHIDKLPVIQAIPLQMEQLFHNLISNALKFSKPDVPPVVRISSRVISAVEANERNFRKGPLVEIVVADNGIGFNEEFAEQIFTIFQRLNSKYEYPGTGIGLALCRKIVINHEGELYAESEPGNGAKFHIILPVKQNVG